MALFGLIKDRSWIGRKSTPSNLGTLTEHDLQLHLVTHIDSIKNNQQAKEILDSIEGYFINARKHHLNAVWYGWFTQLCYRSPKGKEITKMYWHKPFRNMLKSLSKK